MNFFVSLIAGIVSFQAFANGNRVGNGGDVLRCKNAPPVLLDFYESPKTEKSLTGTQSEILKRVYQRLADRWPSLGQQYLNRSQELEKEVEWSSSPLTDIKDSNELLAAPADCTLIQAAIRRTNRSPIAKAFVFQKQIWEQLDERNKAGLISHEIIYEHFSKLGETDSTKAREFNALLFSPDMETQTKATLKKIFEKYRLPAE